MLRNLLLQLQVYIEDDVMSYREPAFVAASTNLMCVVFPSIFVFLVPGFLNRPRAKIRVPVRDFFRVVECGLVGK